MLNKLINIFKLRDKNELSQQETEFLPAVLEITESPPSPVGRGTLWTIIAILVLGLLWSVVGQVDEVAITTGKIIPSGQVKTIQAEDKGVVKAIYVKEGQLVKKGDFLVDLDQTFSAADLARLKKEVAYYVLAIERLTAEYSGGHFDPNTATISDQREADYQRQLFLSRVNDYKARLTVAQSSAAQTKAALASAQANLIKFQNMYEIALDKEKRLVKLVEENAVAYFVLLDQRARRIELEQTVAAQKAEITRIEMALAQSLDSIQQLTTEHDRDISTQLVEARKQLTSYNEELKKAEEKNRLAKITAPVDGRVNQLSIHTIGGIVTTAQPLMNIVPDGTTIEVEAWAANKDIGFIHVGQKAEVKVETFNFQKFGTFAAEVVEISPDAIEDTKDKQSKYRVVLVLAKESVWINERESNLTPGMSVTGEIKIKQKRIIEFFLDPFRQYTHDALRER